MSLTTDIVNKSLENNTASIRQRVLFLNKLYEAGYEVHINFSPVVFYKDWIKDYKALFSFINNNISKEIKEQLKCEVIFLTHNEKLHKYNLENSLKHKLFYIIFFLVSLRYPIIGFLFYYTKRLLD
jgi:DNA repair photolyase